MEGQKEEIRFCVTQLERQTRRPDRINVYLDHAFAFALSEEVFFKYPIHEGDELTESFINEVLLAEEKARAKAKALQYLSHHALSVKQLWEKLLAKDFSEWTIRQVIADLVRVGLLNDEAFAFSYVRSRLQQRPCAKRLLIWELKSKGISEEEAERIVESAYGPESEEEVARQLVLKKWKTKDPGNKKKITDFLFRRGFDWEVIQNVLHEILAFQDQEEIES